MLGLPYPEGIMASLGWYHLFLGVSVSTLSIYCQDVCNKLIEGYFSCFYKSNHSKKSDMEEVKDGHPPEELLDHLKLSDQKSTESTSSWASGPKDAQNLPNLASGDIPSSAKDPTTADECFHDCRDSFEMKEPVLDDEESSQNDENSTRKQTELDEEYLLELEKDMPEEEKQVIQISPFKKLRGGFKIVLLSGNLVHLLQCLWIKIEVYSCRLLKLSKQNALSNWVLFTFNAVILDKVFG